MRLTIMRLVATAVMTCPCVIASETSVIVDGHNHDGISASSGTIVISGLDDLNSRGIDVVMIPLPLDRSESEDIERRIESELEALRRITADAPSVAIGLSSNHPETADTRIHLLFSIEWFGAIFDEDLDRVRRFRDLGVQVISLVEDDPDGLFGTGDLSAELTPFGERIVSAMNDAGVLIDITHLDHPQRLEIIRQSRDPVVATHALAAGVSPTSFNLTDDVVAALANTGGSVWVSFSAVDLLAGDSGGDALEIVADHIEYLIETLGPDHVGIGTDLQAGGRYVPPALNRTDSYSEIERRLLARGHPRATIDGVLGRNIVRTLAVAESENGKRSAVDNAPPAIDWVNVPAGAFTMGTDTGDKPDQGPAHVVELDEFEISKHEITVGQFREFVESTGYITEVERNTSGYGYNGETWVGNPDLTWNSPGFHQEDDHPVVLVTWNDARAFCRWMSELTGRTIDLPTEAQWERAARGDDQRPYPWGEGPVTGARCNFADTSLGNSEFSTMDRDDGFRYTAPVGSFPDGASPYGVEDLCGNVWEWIRDLYAEDYYSRSPVSNPLGPEDGPYNVTRGGAWGIGGPFEGRLRVTFRNINTFGRGFDVIGFRVVRE